MTISLIAPFAKVIGPKIGTTFLHLKKYGPEISLVSGVATGIVAAVLLAKAHKESSPEVEEMLLSIEEQREHIKNEQHSRIDQNIEPLTNKEVVQDMLPLYTDLGVYLVKQYAAPVLLGALSVSLVLGSHGVMKNRQKTLLSTVALLEFGFNEYRKRVVSEFGEDADKRMLFGGVQQEYTTVDTDENGKSKKTKGMRSTLSENPSPLLYARVFSAETSMDWSPDPTYNEFFLRSKQSEANDRLMLKGWVTLNEVYKSLGFDQTPYGAIVGWSKNAPGDDVVLFGIDDYMNNDKPGDNRWALDFNVNGVILDCIGMPNHALHK